MDERWGVKGFLGDGIVTIPELGKTMKIMFVSFRPSTAAQKWGEFPDPKSPQPECKISFENARFLLFLSKRVWF